MQKTIAQFRRVGILGLISSLTLAAGAAQANPILEKSGALEPMRDEYSFTGEAGDTVTIQLESLEFDTILRLLDPSGAELEANDDYNGSLNSTIVITLPESGEYTAVAGSFSGQGGAYDLLVRAATDYEQVYDRAVDFMTSEDYGQAIEAYTAAIALDAEDPNAYLGRADAYWGEAYLSLGEDFEGPNSLPEEARTAIVADYETAADIFEAEGNVDYAFSLREQANYVRTGEYSESQAPL
ncbi:MAG: pre-peptidase C-terminal domain-containing protein [Cyanobacteria bacterium P01_D01_bin.14]